MLLKLLEMIKMRLSEWSQAWIKKVQDSELKAFYTVKNMVKNNLNNILNFLKKKEHKCQSRVVQFEDKAVQSIFKRGYTDSVFLIQIT